MVLLFMANVQPHQGQVDMQLIEMITEVLDTGVLSMSAERRLNTLLNSRDINEMEMRVIDELIDALSTGKIQAIA
ncbi:MAG: hypothetical protein NW220_23210 [Leptolyngbyaceae cyanobacterium bins.349]|nr:hypothetical protein [Leptolyngbyaceae cyanobacterium bins.349]